MYSRNFSKHIYQRSMAATRFRICKQIVSKFSLCMVQVLLLQNNSRMSFQLYQFLVKKMVLRTSWGWERLRNVRFSLTTRECAELSSVTQAHVRYLIWMIFFALQMQRYTPNIDPIGEFGAHRICREKEIGHCRSSVGTRIRKSESIVIHRSFFLFVMSHSCNRPCHSIKFKYLYRVAALETYSSKRRSSQKRMSPLHHDSIIKW